MTAPGPRIDGERALSPLNKSLRQPASKPPHAKAHERDALLARDLELQRPPAHGEDAPGAAAQELATLLELVYPVVRFCIWRRWWRS